MAGSIGELIWQMAGKQDPRQALLQQAAGIDTSGASGVAPDTSGGAGTGAATAAPAGSDAVATGPMPETMKTTPDMMDLYTQLADKSRFEYGINHGIGLILSSFAAPENRDAVRNSLVGGGGSDGASGGGGSDSIGGPLGFMTDIMKFQEGQTAIAQKAAHRAALPAIAKQYGLDLETTQYLFDTGKLDQVIQEAEKPNKQIVQDAVSGQNRIVDLTDGSMSEPFGAPKKREVEIVTDSNTGRQFPVYKDDKTPVGGKDLVPGQRKTEMVEGQNGEKFAVYSDTKERVDGKPVVPGVRKTEIVTDGNTGEQRVVYSDTKEPVPGRAALVNGVRKTKYIDLPDGGKRLVFEDTNKPVGTGDIASIGSTDKAKLWHDAMVDRAKRGEPEIPLEEWLTSHEKSSAADANSVYGNPPTDMAWKRDDKGNIQVDANGAPQAVPIAGTKLANETATAKTATAGKEDLKQSTANIVSEDIDRAIKTIDDNSNTWLPVTGLPGATMMNIPGTDAGELAGMLDTIKGNIGFDKLNAIRASNTTGGGLGPISDFENQLLQSTFGSLRQQGQEGNLKYNLNRIKKLYTYLVTRPDDKPITSPAEAMAIMGNDPSAGEPEVDPEVEALIGKYGKKK